MIFVLPGALCRPAAVALALRRIIGLRYVLRVCGPDIPGFERRYQIIHFFIVTFDSAIWRGADRLIAKSAGEIEMIHAVDTRVDRLFIPNGVDLDSFKPAPVSSRDGPLKFICVGRLIERKGQHQLIEAVKRLTDEGYVLDPQFGTGDARPGNEDLALSLGSSDRIRFVGYVPREDNCYSLQLQLMFLCCRPIMKE